MPLGKSNMKLEWASYPRADSREPIGNPFCGLYTIYRYFCHEEIMPDLQVPIEECPLEEKQGVSLVEINLNAFADAAISDEALAIVERIFRFYQRAGRPMILRFLYDWDGKNIQLEPKSIQIIKRHMTQLSPLLKKYTAWIYILQGLFVGSWGEMHNSRYLSPTSLYGLATHLLNCIGDATFMSVRSPAIWRTIARSFSPIEERDAYSKQLMARCGLFNDGMLASQTDEGTYGDQHQVEASALGDKLTRETELAFQEKLCRFVPNGGEVIRPCEYNDFPRAINDLKAMRISYLNDHYDTKVWAKWDQLQLRRDWGIWNNVTVGDYIRTHIGYSFRIDELVVSLVAGDTLHVKLDVSNTGFAPCYRELEISVILRCTTDGTRVEQTLDTSTRTWMPGRKVFLTADLPVADMKGKRSLLCINARDPISGVHVKFSNAFAAQDAIADCMLGAVILRS